MRLKFIVLPLVLGVAATLGACQSGTESVPSDPAASPSSPALESPGAAGTDTGLESPAAPEAPASPEAPAGGTGSTP